MPSTRPEVEALLERLESCCADDLESQDLDFKEWDTRSLSQSVRTVVAAAVCMANGGGGTVVFGVADKLVGRDSAILGVPPEVSVNRLRVAVYDSTDPKLTPVFQELHVPEGTGRLILMHVHPGMPPYTDTGGRGTIRIGRDCKPLTGTLRRSLLEETEDHDFSAGTVDAPLRRLISPVAMESLRDAATAERAPGEPTSVGRRGSPPGRRRDPRRHRHARHGDYRGFAERHTGARSELPVDARPNVLRDGLLRPRRRH